MSLDYEKCKCDKHPATHEQDFDMLISEFYAMNDLLVQKIDATCSMCQDKFTFTNDYTH